MTQLLSHVIAASVHGSLVIAAVVLLRPLLKKTPRKFLCLLWLLAFARLLLPVELRSPTSIQPETVTVAQLQQEQKNAAPVFRNPEKPTPAAPEISNQPQPSTVQPDTMTAEPERDYAAAAAIVWLAVAGGFGVFALTAYLRLKYRVRFAVQSLGYWECDEIETAFILGFLKPRIYIPSRMRPETRDFILAHERTHLEKGDHWFKLVGYLALAVHWFNPLVWLAYVLFCKDIEMACDERVVQFLPLTERKAYSKALLECSTNRVHYAACPVAFGEVSVRYRIRSILRYRRPGFWISLAGVIAIAFVGLCLVTSPVEKPEEAVPSMEVEETAPETTAETGEPSHFAKNLTLQEIPVVCAEAIDRLCNAESYRIATETLNIHESYESINQSDICRYGDDKLVLVQEVLQNGKVNLVNSQVLFGDLWGMHYGDCWVKEGTRAESPQPDVNSWLKSYSPEGKEITFPEGTGILSDDTVSFCMEWSYPSGTLCDATMTYTFRQDGDLDTMRMELRPKESPEERTIYTLQVLEDTPQNIYQTIEAAAAQCIDREQLEQYRNRRDVVTEIPSNKTDYDVDFNLGCASKQWTFLDKAWNVRIGGENATPTGITMVYSESGEGHGSFVAEEGFWLERWENHLWSLVKSPFELSPDGARELKVSWTGTDSYALDWSGSYGSLPAGFYRVGRYYTVKMPSGETETNVCYAKFQLREAGDAALVELCQSGVEALLAKESYHLLVTDYMKNEDLNGLTDPDRHYMTTEVWRSGSDYLEENRYYYKSDNSLKAARCYAIKSGVGYSFDTELSAPATAAEKAEYLETGTFEMWSWFISWQGDDMASITRQGNTITVRSNSDFYRDIPYIDEVFAFDDAGNLMGYSKIYVRDTGEQLVDTEMKVLDTPAQEIRSLMDSLQLG